MSTAQAKGVDRDFYLDEGMVSSCDPSNPVWKIYFSSSDYNSNTRWMNVYNARLAFFDVPVLYLPYFGYSLDKRRRSGLLTPGFGLSNSEGLYYEQPFYIAVDDRWDLELRPQIRTARGKGLYGDFRFVDSRHANGTLSFGYFKENASYKEQYNLANEKHYGVSLDYENVAFMQDWFGADVSGQSGVYSDIMWMNDVDYLNLQNSDETQNMTSKQVDSRINVFYNNDENYIGAYFKYYLDLGQKSNARTIQKLPLLHYHRYFDTIFDNSDFFTYKLNITATNFYREEGKNALQSDILLPLKAQRSFFDNYLDAAYRLDLYGRHILFSGDPIISNPNVKYDSGIFARMIHNVSIASSLTKRYGEYVHTITPQLLYRRAQDDYKSGYYEDYETLCQGDFPWNSEVCDYYNINLMEDTTQINFTQYIHRGTEQILYHKLAQNINLESDKNRYSELENELDLLLWSYLHYYNNTFFNHTTQKITKLLNSIRYNDGTIVVGINHLYEDTVRSRTEVKNSYITADVSYRYNNRYRYFAKYDFDFENSVQKRLEAGFLYSKRCWDFGLRYVENNRPVLTNDTYASMHDRYIYVTFALKPMGGTEINYKISSEAEGE